MSRRVVEYGVIPLGTGLATGGAVTFALALLGAWYG